MLFLIEKNKTCEMARNTSEINLTTTREKVPIHAEPKQLVMYIKAELVDTDRLKDVVGAAPQYL